MRLEDITLQHLLRTLIERHGSDLHISVNSPPRLRVDGALVALEDYPPLDADTTRRLALTYTSDEQREKFGRELALDFAVELPGLSRFRGNLFDQREGTSAVFRAIPVEIRSFEDLGLPPVVEELCERPRGLILVTGPTGSGKSTTLAAMLDKINRERSQHIITIEDPVEFLHRHKRCLVNQREIGTNTLSFAQALRETVRQDPDVVLVGELRDLETIEAALRIAETGHLTLATLHTNSAPSTITRIIDVFPAMQQAQIRTQLSQVLEGVLCQQLLHRKSGKGRVMALEIMLPTPAVRNLIRNDKIHQLHSAMDTGQTEHGMTTLNHSLADLYVAGDVDLPAALKCSPDQRELRDLIESRGRGAVSFASPAAVNGGVGGGLMADSLGG